MIITNTQPHTLAELLAAADADAKRYPANREYHAAEYVVHTVRNAERAAYAEQDRRTIRPRYITALDAVRTMTAERERVATIKYQNVRRAAGLPAGWQPELLDHSDAAQAHRDRCWATTSAADARNTLARATSLGATEYRLIDAAEAGEIEPCMLLATVPDEFGRISPFAVHVTVAETSRSYSSRNLRLSDALDMARAENAKGNRASVGFDTCG
jgi:hypothetical protein